VALFANSFNSVSFCTTDLLAQDQPFKGTEGSLILRTQRGFLCVETH